MSFKVGIIGHTGRGNYGHYLDMAFIGVEGADIAALADPDDAGRAEAAEKTGARTAYADYREMLSTWKSRWPPRRKTSTPCRPLAMSHR